MGKVVNLEDFKSKLKKINEKNKTVVNSYEQLVKELKSHKIDPQEAYNLAYKNKYQYNSIYYWAMTRIGMYMRERLIEHYKIQYDVRKKHFKKLPPEKLKKNITVGQWFENLKISEKKIIEDETISSYKKKIDTCKKIVNRKSSFKAYAGVGKILDSLFALPGAPSREDLKYSDKPPNEPNYKDEFKKFNPREKFDPRKEIQNLHKLVTEKRHRKKFYKANWDYSINKAMQTHSRMSKSSIKICLS